MSANTSGDKSRIETLERMAQTGTAESFLNLPDDEKRLFFALAVDESERRKHSELELKRREHELTEARALIAQMLEVSSKTDERLIREDIKIGSTLFRVGVKLRIVLERIERGFTYHVSTSDNDDEQRNLTGDQA